jgi:choline dehydrogenase-like flavoprotein
VKTLDGVCDDWPIAYDDLTPYYHEIAQFIGVSGLTGDSAYPLGPDYPQSPLPIGKAGRRAAEGMNRMGWHWWPGDQAIPSNRIQNLEPCARYGVCERGCPNGSKASFDLSYWPQAITAGTRLVTGARVRRVLTGTDGRASGVEWIDRDGAEHVQRANAVVLCANSVGTARLLLLSANAQHPDGLGNSSGLVGKNLMLHPNCGVTGYYDDDLESWLGPAGQLIASMQFYETDPARGLVRGAKWQALPLPGPFAGLQVHRALPFDQVWGDRFHDVVSTHGRGFIWAANVEDLPEEHNRVTLDPELTDDDGIPAPKLTYKMSDNTRGLLSFTIDRMLEAHQAGGAREVFPVGHRLDSPGHILGTARMGANPDRSVVDPFGRAHDVDNLFIADGSIFVTSGAVNPTNSITALALRTARHLADTASEQKASA